MPGPVSDSYDPEFSTGSNRGDVYDAIKELRDVATGLLGYELKYIVAVAQGPPGKCLGRPLTERQWRVLRFSLNRVLEEI